MDLKEGELHIWRYTLNDKDYVTEKKNPILSKAEQERCDDYLHESDKIRYTCNHRFVRQVLAKYLNVQPSEIEFSLAPMGKPYVKNTDVFFSYSYRSNLGLLALSKNEEVGVDIERMKILQDIPTFTDFCFSEKEKKIIFDSDDKKFQKTLFTFWTFKEAIIKCLGVGLNADLTQIDLADFFYTDSNMLSYDNDAMYTIKNIKAVEGYMAAFAVKGKFIKHIEFDHCEN